MERRRVQPAEPGVVATRAVDRGAGDESGTTAASYTGAHRHQAKGHIMGKLIVTEFVTLDGVA